MPVSSVQGRISSVPTGEPKSPTEFFAKLKEKLPIEGPGKKTLEAVKACFNKYIEFDSKVAGNKFDGPRGLQNISLEQDYSKDRVTLEGLLDMQVSPALKAGALKLFDECALNKLIDKNASVLMSYANNFSFFGLKDSGKKKLRLNGELLSENYLFLRDLPRETLVKYFTPLIEKANPSRGFFSNLFATRRISIATEALVDGILSARGKASTQAPQADTKAASGQGKAAPEASRINSQEAVARSAPAEDTKVEEVYPWDHPITSMSLGNAIDLLIRQKAYEKPGILRESGNETASKALADEFHGGKPVSTADKTPQVVASAIKKILSANDTHSGILHEYLDTPELELPYEKSLAGKMLKLIVLTSNSKPKTEDLETIAGLFSSASGQKTDPQFYEKIKVLLERAADAWKLKIPE
jgi:hypothetical protein